MPVGVLMAEGAAGSGFAFTSDMFSGLLTTIQTNASVLVPVGVGIFAILVSIRFAPKIIKALASA